MPLSGGGQLGDDFIHNSNYVWRGYLGPALVWEPIEKLFFTTNNSGDNNNFKLWVNQTSGDTNREIHFLVVKNSSTIKEVNLITGGVGPVTIDLLQPTIQAFVKCHSPVFNLVEQISIDGLGANEDWGIQTVFPAIFPNLTKFTVSNQASITNVNLASNTKIQILEIHDTSLTGTLDVSTMPNLKVLRASDNNLTSLSALTNNPDLEIINVNKNASLSGSLNFSNCPNITTILASQTNISSVNVVGRTNLVRLEINKCANVSQAFDFTSCPNLEVFDAELAQISSCIFDNNNKIRGFFVSHNTIPQAEIQSGLLANKATLEAVSLQVMPQLTAALNFDDYTNLHFIWAASLVNCAGISFNNLTNLTNLNISGMTNLTSLPALGTNPLNAFVWVTGTSIGPSGVDALLNHISSMNVPPIQEHPEGPGCIIYGPYEGIPTPIHPTSASLAAYNDLVSRGYTIIGPVPGT